MPLPDILEKILSDAEFAAEKIRRAARLKVVEIEREADDKIAKIEANLAQEGTEKAENIRQKTHVLSVANRKTALSEAKQRVLLDVLQEAQAAFTRLPESDREAMYCALLTKIQGEKGTLFPARGEAKILDRAVKKLGIEFSLGEELNEEKGGFLFTSPRLDADARLSLLLQKEIFPKIEKELSEILFSE